MRSINAVFELRSVCNLPRPCLSGGKGLRTWWLPQDRRPTLLVRTNEVPLLAAEVRRLSYQIYALIGLSDLNSKPAVIPSAHLGGDQTGGDLLPGEAVGPSDADRSGICARPDDPLPCKLV